MVLKPYLLKARNVKPAETAVAGEQRGNKPSPGVSYAVCSIFPYPQESYSSSGKRGCYIRTNTTRI
jgi:hypothetical protein